MAVPTFLYLYPLNDQVIEIDGLQDTVSGIVLDAATVTATLKDQNGNPDPTLQNLTLSYVGGSNGNYSGVVSAAFNPKMGGGYTLIIDAVQAGAVMHLEIPVIIKARTQ